MKKWLFLLFTLITIKSAQMSFIRRSRKGRTQSKIYDVEDTPVLVSWQEFIRVDQEPLLEKAVIFFPGWPLRADSKSIRELSEEFANSSGARTLVIHTRSEQIILNPIYQEARAVCGFLAEQKLKNITLIGYSQGAIKAIDTIVFLQETKPNIQVEGLILIVPVGLNNVVAGALIRRYVTDFLITSLLAVLREIGRKPSLREKLDSLVESMVLIVRSCLSFFLAILKEVKLSRLGYLHRFTNEVKEMSQRSPYLDKIGVPIVLIQGAYDHVSDRASILTQTKAQAIKVGLQDQTEERSKTDKKIKEQILIESLFPQSPDIRIVKAQKFGTHLLPLFRSKPVAKASLYLLQRSR